MGSETRAWEPAAVSTWLTLNTPEERPDSEVHLEARNTPYSPP